MVLINYYDIKMINEHCGNSNFILSVESAACKWFYFFTCIT